MKDYVKFLRIALVAIIVVLGLSQVANAQEITGAIVGTVKDSAGASVPGATVTVTNRETKIAVRTVQTNDEGQYSVGDLPATNYDVAFEARGFKKQIQNNVEVNVGARRTLDATLDAGDISEVVTIEANPVAVELSNATVGTVISGEQATQLALNNRNWVQLITLAPGVSNDLADQVYVGTTNPAGQANTMNIAVNGARSAQNTYTVDGADVTDRGSNITIQAYPSVDSIAEFKVQRSLFPAESGRSGGGQINVVTRGGGREFHGSLFEFVRNDKLNANDFISNRATNPAFGRESNGKAKRAPFRYNNFGGTLSGPVMIPLFGEGGSAVKKLKRTFFFFSEEQRKDRRYPSLTGSVPDLNMRRGIFPMDVCIRANVPTTATATCLEVLPAGQPLASRVPINPVAQQYLDFIYNRLPAPSDPVTRALVFPASGIADFRQEIIRLDHAFNDAVSLYYRYENDKIPTIDANSLFSSGSGLPGVSTSSTNSPGKAHSAQLTWVVNPSLAIIGRWNYGYGAILSETVGSMALDNSPIAPGLAYARTKDFVPTVTGNGFSTLTTFGDYDNFSYKHNFSGDVAWTQGKHSLKFGGMYSYYRKNENNLAGNNAGGFSGFLNTVPNSVVQSSVLAPNAAAGEPNATRRGNFQAFANFLMGNNVAFSQSRFDYVADFRQFTFESYAQDEWRARKNLTVYYGVRHSYFGQPYDRNGRLSNFVPALFSLANAPRVTGAGNRVAGTGNFCNGMIVNSQNVATAANNCTPAASPFGKYIVDAPTKNFAPRFGLAWDPFGKGRTSIRTGYGMYYDQILNGWALQIIGTNPPYQETFTVSAVSGGTGTVATTPRLDQPVPSGVTVAAGASLTALNVRAMEPDWKDPYMQHWSIEGQHMFDNKTMISVGYFGSKGTHLIGGYELNEIPPGQALTRQCATGTDTLQTVGAVLVPCQVAGTYFGGTTGGVSSNILDQIRPYRGYRSITMITPQFNSNYNSLQVMGQRRFSGASQVNVAYTWAKNLTDNITDRSDAPQNSYNIRQDRGKAALDRRHIFTANYIYELPFFKGRHDLVGNVLGGWELSGIVSLQSGLWYTVTTNFDAAGLGNIPALIAGNRANTLCDPNQGGARTFEQWFNIACFERTPTAAPVANVVGSGGRGTIEGPPTHRMDLSVFKRIRFGERVSLQLRAEAFNVLNHTNFRNLSGTSKIAVTSATFGQINAVRDPRTIQLGAKLSF